MLFALPFIILTFGLGIWLINAVLFLLVGNLVSGFSVDSFWYALAGAFVVSLTGAAANLLFGNARVSTRINVQRNRNGGPGSGASSGTSSGQGRRRPLKDDDDVIDV
jgi:putative membrane protein